MGCSRNTCARGAPRLFAFLAWLPVSIALAQGSMGGHHRPDGRDRPDCPSRCKAVAEHMIEAALDMGWGAEDAQARAQAFLDRRHARCERPEPPRCEEACEQRAEAAMTRCVQHGGSDDDCQAIGDLVRVACLVHCGEEPLPCRKACAKKAAEAYRGCMDDPDADASECREAANEALEACAARCPEEPSPCEDRCATLRERMGIFCADLPENRQGGCIEAADAFLALCQKGCEAPEPEPEPCISVCERMTEVVARMCARLTDTPEACEELEARFAAACTDQVGEACLEDERLAARGFRRFLRGDVRRDRKRDIADAIAILLGLFQGDPGIFDCLDAADANDDGAVDIGDAVRLLQHLFARGGPLPPPFWMEGFDETADGLGCGTEEDTGVE